MNIAVLIGISEYDRADNLPPCKRDVSLMKQLLEATGKYEPIHAISENTTSANVKESLRNFFQKYRGVESIDEALLYFSGHGTYSSDALFCCSDFDSSRPSTTSLSNAEIDDLLRSVSPTVAVKIVDACQSGAPYIKDVTPSFKRALGESKLNSFICMASSMTNQPSVALPESSVFTASFLKSALAKEEGTILYRDIQAGLADAFVGNEDQTPYFVNQGTGLEVFAQVNEAMRALSNARSVSPAPDGEDGELDAAVAAEIARREAAQVKYEEACKAVESAAGSIERAIIRDAIVERYYTKLVSLGEKWANAPAPRPVANFFSEAGREQEYFVAVIKESYKEKVLRTPLSLNAVLGASTGFSGGQSDDDYVTTTRMRPRRIQVSEVLPFEVAKVEFIPKQHTTLKSFVTYIGLVHSLSDLTVMHTTSPLEPVGWKKHAVDETNVKWKYFTLTWKQAVDNPDLIWSAALTTAETMVLEYIQSLVPQKQDASKPHEEAAADQKDRQDAD